MFNETIEQLAQAAVKKKELLDQSRWRYLLAAALAGVYVGIGIILIFSVGAPLFAAKSAVTSLVMGASFGIALTLVIFAGAELFTGNNMIFTFGSLSGTVSWKDAFKNWTWSFAGNLIGAMLLVLLVVGAGIFKGIPADHLLMTAAAKKMGMSTTMLFFRGILCNWLVCLAIWSATRAKSDSAKLVLIWWMLFAFIASGYEHSVANMTVLGLALILPHPDTITLAGWFHNMIPVTLGNMVGGAVFMAGIYWIISPVRRRQAKPAVTEASSQSQSVEPKANLAG